MLENQPTIALIEFVQSFKLLSTSMFFFVVLLNSSELLTWFISLLYTGLPLFMWYLIKPLFFSSILIQDYAFVTFSWSNVVTPNYLLQSLSLLLVQIT